MLLEAPEPLPEKGIRYGTHTHSEVLSRGASVVDRTRACRFTNRRLALKKIGMCALYLRQDLRRHGLAFGNCPPD